MKIVDVKQGSEQWFYARAGIPTASDFDNILTSEWKIRTGQMPETYLYRKLAERCMGIPLQSGGSWAMDQGVILESEAIPWFEFVHGVKVDRVGFVTTDDGRIGCSPDGLIGEVGGVEIKCPQPDTHLKYFLQGGVPKDYLAQIHGSMFVTGRPWWMFMSYSRQFPPLVIKIDRDEKIMTAMRTAIDGFLTIFDAKFSTIKSIKDGENQRKTAEYEKVIEAELAAKK